MYIIHIYRKTNAKAAGRVSRTHPPELINYRPNSLFVYYESIKRELKRRPIYECRCDERLQTKTKEFTPRLTIKLFLGY